MMAFGTIDSGGTGMKQCKVYSGEKQNETDGIIIDGHVFLPAPRRDEAEPACIVDGQCYYPPFYAVEFAKDLHFDLMPFSTECEWGEYTDEDNPAHNVACYWGGDDYDYEVKWGCCDTKSGQIRIAPAMEYCDTFNKQGAAIIKACMYFIMNTEGEIYYGAYHKIRKSFHGVFLVFATFVEGWGAVDSEGHDITEPLEYWKDIEWDGMGGFTVTYNDRTGHTKYCVLCHYPCDATNLTEKPAPYDFPAEKRRIDIDRDDDFYSERFRLTQRDDKYGLVRDVIWDQDDPAYAYSERVLEPIFDYDEIPDEAYNAWRNEKIRYFAWVLARTPGNYPERIRDIWDGVPEDIIEDVARLWPTMV
jgi:hypothetical protein